MKTPRHYWNIASHRIVKPTLWRTRLASGLQNLSRPQFLSLCSYKGSEEAFEAWMHEELRHRFFFHPRNRKDFFLNLLTASQSYESILQEAEDTLRNTFETLGSGKVSLGDRINWQKDFKSGKEWDLEPSALLDVLDLGNPSDVKVPWELSRFHQTWWLGKAYWLTGNEQYAEKFRSLVEQWIEENPAGRGVNWVVAMEAAIRACNMIAGYYLFCSSKSIPQSFWLSFFQSLYVHGIFIRYNTEYSWQNGNHFLSNVTGLIFLGIFFRHTSFGREWLAWGVDNLVNEMKQEVYPDGVDFEKSTSYHRLVLELFYTSTILCRLNKVELPKSFLNRLENMFDFVQHYTRPDGSIPLLGDADDGRLFRLRMNENVNDHRHALSVGAILFERRDFRASAGVFSQDALWMFGGEGFEKHQQLGGERVVALSSKAFPEGGFYCMRGEAVHLIVDAGELGQRGRGGHGHNDVLSFELWAHGGSLVVDSGTYAYSFDPEARQQFRGTRAHNTIVVDRTEIAEFSGLWQVREDRTDPRVIEWKPSKDEDILEAEHYAYKVLPSPVVHRRRFSLKKSSVSLSIIDTLAGSGSHTVESFLHFAPGLRLEIMNQRTAVVTHDKERYLISSSAGSWSAFESWYSKSYGVRERNMTLRMTLKAELPLTVELNIRDA